jgi:hypothetical protein
MFAHHFGRKIQPHSFVPNGAAVLKTIETRFLYFFMCFSGEPNGRVRSQRYTYNMMPNFSFYGTKDSMFSLNNHIGENPHLNNIDIS